MVSTPWRNSVYRIAFILLVVGTVLMLLSSAKSLVTSFWNGGAVYVVGTLLGCALLVYGGYMLMHHDRYSFRFASIVLLLGAFSTMSGALLRWIVPLCLLVSALGFRGNQPFRFWFFRKLPTSWLCLVGAACSGVSLIVRLLDTFRALSLLSDAANKTMYNYAGTTFAGAAAMMVISAAFFLFLFFTQTMPRPEIRDCTVSRAERNRGNLLLTLTGILMLVRFVLVVLPMLRYGAPYSGMILLKNAAPLLLYFVTAILLWRAKKENILWLCVIFLYLSMGTSFFPFIFFVILFMDAVGYTGNTEVSENGRIRLTMLEIFALGAVVLMLVDALHGHVSNVLKIIDGQPHKLTAFYRKEAIWSLLPSYGRLLTIAAVGLTVLGRKLVMADTTVVAKALRIFVWMKNVVRDFQKNSGTRIQRLAYVFSTIFMICCLVSLSAATVVLVIWILEKAFPIAAECITWAPSILLAVYGYGLALSCFLSALGTRLTYAFGQITGDVHGGALFSGKTSVRSIKASDTDSDLPEF